MMRYAGNIYSTYDGLRDFSVRIVDIRNTITIPVGICIRVKNAAIKHQ